MLHLKSREQRGVWFKCYYINVLLLLAHISIETFTFCKIYLSGKRVVFGPIVDFVGREGHWSSSSAQCSIPSHHNDASKHWPELKKNTLWGLDFVSLYNFLLVLLNFGCGYLARISNTKLNMNIWRRKSSNSNQFYTLNKAFLSQHTPYRCTWKYGFDNIDSQYLWLLPTRGRYFMMLANGARGALFWRASHLEEK